jgi:hypothetical protein
LELLAGEDCATKGTKGLAKGDKGEDAQRRYVLLVWAVGAYERGTWLDWQAYYCE